MPDRRTDQTPERGVGEVASGRLLAWMGGLAAFLLLSLAAMFGVYGWLANGPQTAQTFAPTPRPQLETHLFRSDDVPPQTPPGQKTRPHAPADMPIGQAMQIIAAKGVHGFDPLDAAPSSAASPEGAR